MAKHMQPITSLCDMQRLTSLIQYRLGMQTGSRRRHGPQSDRSFIAQLTDDIEQQHFSWLPFRLGHLHGRLLDPHTHAVRPAVPTLVTLSDPDFTRGYQAGRVWFFYETDPDERRLSELLLEDRLRELAAERQYYRDAQATIAFALGCLLGELSGWILPLTAEEDARIQEEDRLFLAAYDAEQAARRQLQETEPLAVIVTQEA